MLHVWALAHQSTWLLCWSTSLPKSWSWLATPRVTTNVNALCHVTCNWLCATTRNWTNCSAVSPLPRVVLSQTYVGSLLIFYFIIIINIIISSSRSTLFFCRKKTNPRDLLAFKHIISFLEKKLFSIEFKKKNQEVFTSTHHTQHIMFIVISFFKNMYWKELSFVSFFEEKKTKSKYI